MLSSYSYSALGTFQTCPRKYKFAYIEKIDLPKRITADAYMGNAVHRTLDMLYRNPVAAAVPLEDIIRFYLAEWEKPDKKDIVVVNEYQTVDDYINDGRKMLEDFYDKYKPFNRGKTIGTELNLQFELDGTSFKMKAKIDRLWKRDDNVIEICDYKTGRMPAEGVKDKSFYHQMGIYQMAVRAKYPHWEEIDLAQYFLKYDEIIRRRLRPDELDELKEEVRTSILETINAERLDDFPTVESGLCNYCEYFKYCPAKRHKLLLDEEEAAGEKEKTSVEAAAERTDRYLEQYNQVRLLTAELEALKQDLIRFAKDLDLNKLVGKNGEVLIKISEAEKFVTKTADPKAFAELSHLAREIGLEEYFRLDGRALMKEIYKKERLSPEMLEVFKKFVVNTEETRVTARLKKDNIDEE
ncbi:MAG: PD-(D/E)XK nuclease family protein [candidate division Zixibacteria bacterium]|nr:PD-(D/E)XK nuclease family protein [candidate division Zixibacteria bacterium]